MVMGLAGQSLGRNGISNFDDNGAPCHTGATRCGLLLYIQRTPVPGQPVQRVMPDAPRIAFGPSRWIHCRVNRTRSLLVDGSNPSRPTVRRAHRLPRPSKNRFSPYHRATKCRTAQVYPLTTRSSQSAMKCHARMVKAHS